VWLWVVGGLVVWVLFALVVAVVVGRGIRVADVRAGDAPLPAHARTPRRRVPIPPVGVALAGTAVVLETIGYVVRLTGASGSTARALSMDAPYSVPRVFVAGLFAAAAVAAVAGAARNPGRRTWWLAVGLVAAFISAVKLGSTVHAEGMGRLEDAVGEPAAVALSVLIAAGVIAVLAFVSRAERRDRRRVLSCLAGYAVASVGLSAVSAAVTGRLAITATFLEESGEALAGVAVLLAVLVGVAPRLVLPAEWVLRREADAATVDAPQTRPGAVRS
jgi:hypothetical protein